MRQTWIMMDMPITVEIVGTSNGKYFKEVFEYFKYIDEKFSVFRIDSEVSKFNRGEIKKKDLSRDLKDILELAEKTKKETNGYFDIRINGKLDPSGIVKGFAIYCAAKLIEKRGFKNFYVDAGGDIQTSGLNSKGKVWKVGIRNPFDRHVNVKVVQIKDRGIATSGTYIRGFHIYDPFNPGKKIEDIVSLTVIGKNIFEADRFATAAFAMGKKGIEFIESQPGLEGYLIDKDGLATMTTGFNKFVLKDDENN